MEKADILLLLSKSAQENKHCSGTDRERQEMCLFSVR